MYCREKNQEWHRLAFVDAQTHKMFDFNYITGSCNRKDLVWD